MNAADSGGVVVSIMVCDDSASVRAGIRRALAAVPEVRRVSDTASGEEMLARYPVEHPDMVFLDSIMPGLGGTESLRRLLHNDPRAIVVMLTAGEEPAAVADSVSLGAFGYVPKDASPQELAAVLSALHGRHRQHGLPAQRVPRDPGLTEREQQVLRGMSEGRSNAQIGKELFLSEDTVKTHARRLFRKLNVADRGHAVAEGIRRGLI